MYSVWCETYKEMESILEFGGRIRSHSFRESWRQCTYPLLMILLNSPNHCPALRISQTPSNILVDQECFWNSDSLGLCSFHCELLNWLLDDITDFRNLPALSLFLSESPSPFIFLSHHFLFLCFLVKWFTWDFYLTSHNVSCLRAKTVSLFHWCPLQPWKWWLEKIVDVQ